LGQFEKLKEDIEAFLPNYPDIFNDVYEKTLKAIADLKKQKEKEEKERRLAEQKRRNERLKHIRVDESLGKDCEVYYKLIEDGITLKNGHEVKFPCIDGIMTIREHMKLPTVRICYTLCDDIDISLLLFKDIKNDKMLYTLNLKTFKPTKNSPYQETPPFMMRYKYV
jgi:hypothetical protein